jgi:hypothetical protein
LGLGYACIQIGTPSDNGKMATSTISLSVKENNGEVARHREDVARKVIDYFGEHPILPSWRVICLLDDRDFQDLKSQAGEANQGIHLSLEHAILRARIPQYFWDIIRPYDRTNGKCLSVFDSVVYLHGSTCETDIGLTLTLAHELRHSFQHSAERRICEANTMLQLLPEPFKRNFTVWWDLPIERDARVVAKAAAEAIFGREAVARFLETQVEAAVTEDDRQDWVFVLNIDTGTSYKFAAETRRLVRVYRSGLKQLQQDLEQQNRSGFPKIDFDAGSWNL